jgi:AAA ATPase domain
MLGERQKAAARELAQWWDALRLGGTGSHAVLLAGPAGWGRSTVLDQLPGIIRADAPISLEVRMNGRSLPDGPAQQAQALRDSLLGADVRRQAAALLCRSRLRGAPRLGAGSLLLTGMAGTISLLMAGLSAAAAGGVADDCPASENGAAARAARIVAAVSASAPTLVVIDDADYLEPGLAVTVIENLIYHHDSRVLVVAAVDLGSDLAAALTSRARYGPTVGRVHRADADPRMGYQSRAELAGELRPHLTAAQAQQIARQTRTFAEIFTAGRSEPLP